MPGYAEQTTAELIDRLFKEEDRVTVEHVQELARRGDEAVGPLREALRNEQYWNAGEYGEFWIEMHAITILGAMRALEALPELMAAIIRAYHAENDWLVPEHLATALAQFGEAAVEPLVQYLREHRDSYRTDDDYSYARNVAATALARIAYDHPDLRPRIVDFLCGLLTDPLEGDALFLSFMADLPVALDRERGLNALRIAYGREVIDESICGDYDDFASLIDQRSDEPPWELTRDLFEFYQPEEIAKRQQRWKNEAKEESQRYVAGVGPAGLKYQLAQEFGSAVASSRAHHESEEDEWEDEAAGEEQPTSAPTGYARTAEGTLVRTERVGRNDPCPCGSGKKFKKCCGKEQ